MMGREGWSVITPNLCIHKIDRMDPRCRRGRGVLERGGEGHIYC
jgi:hypothetical protein